RSQCVCFVGIDSVAARNGAGKPALTARLEPLIAIHGFTGNAPRGPSRWSTERSTIFPALMGDKVKIVKLNVDESPKKPWAASAMKTRSQVHN
ncbi:MAG TPA: hypothetical protein VK621_11075, partial [Bradyrhizobium sp.]|nr:hypothetical protein [Bradyrhizobium sp.]